jgi:hypothetical protein
MMRDGAQWMSREQRASLPLGVSRLPLFFCGDDLGRRTDSAGLKLRQYVARMNSLQVHARGV